MRALHDFWYQIVQSIAYFMDALKGIWVHWSFHESPVNVYTFYSTKQKKSQRIELELYVPVYSADQILDFLLVERSYMKNWSQI